MTAERKLSTILAADVVGYSRLMAADEEGTADRLKAAREVVDRRIAEHHGRIFHTAGDSVVAEFASPVEALRCAVEIQQALAQRNDELPEASRMQLRIGVNLGDVMIDGDNLLGDGINVAARLESIADPGGICISGSVHEQVSNKLDVGYDDLGPRSLKNIPQPVRVYRVRVDGTQGRAPQIGKPRHLRNVVTVAVGVILLLAGGIWLSWPAPLGLVLDYAGVSSLPQNPPLPEKPSVVVLPFANLSDDPEQEFLADGLTEDITADLAQLKWLFVISRSTAFSYKGQALNVADVSRELGVRYLVEGSVRKAGDRVRVTVQLIDAPRDVHTWSERYDRDIDDLLGLQTEITEHIITALGVEIPEAEARRFRRKPTTSLSAYEAQIRGVVELRKFSRSSLAEAQALLERAVQEDPAYAAAHAILALSYAQERFLYCPADPSRLPAAAALAERAIELDAYEPMAYIALASTRFVEHRFQEALASAQRAVDLGPNLDVAQNFLGGAYLMNGQPLRGLTAMGRAVRLSPRPAPVFLGTIGVANYAAGQLDQGVAFLEKARAASPDLVGARVWLAAHYESIGDHARASTVAREVLDQNPNCTVEHLFEIFGPLFPPELTPMLERAGFPKAQAEADD